LIFSLKGTEMKNLLLFALLLTHFPNSRAVEPVDSIDKIKNFHFVSKTLASSGLLNLDDYQHIKNYGFKHVINLIPGEQHQERQTVQALSMSYQQIPVDWAEPTLQDFERFSLLMKKYGDDSVYVHCEANYRASTFVYLYRTINLGIEEKIAKKDLALIWTPDKTWQGFIEKIRFNYLD
jgi:protein tyrosine phosphatase (PTP) superfamily phosphohydrolase (DUF442 family)